MNGTLIPVSPFLWYRENELTCSFDFIRKIPMSEFTKIYNDNNISENCYIVIQKHLLENANIYICNHTFAYYHDTNNKRKDIISQSFNKIYRFNIYSKLLTVDDVINEIDEIGLKINNSVTGPVYIHDGAFSPPGCFHFKMKSDILFLYVKGTCSEINKDYSCLFILLDETKEHNAKYDTIIHNIINKLKI